MTKLELPNLNIEIPDEVLIEYLAYVKQMYLNDTLEVFLQKVAIMAAMVDGFLTEEINEQNDL